jgi:hypothetical protein
MLLNGLWLSQCVDEFVEAHGRVVLLVRD